MQNLLKKKTSKKKKRRKLHGLEWLIFAKVPSVEGAVAFVWRGATVGHGPPSLRPARGLLFVPRICPSRSQTKHPGLL